VPAHNYDRTRFVTKDPLALIQGEVIESAKLAEYRHQVKTFEEELLEAKANYEDVKELAEPGVSNPHLGTLGMLVQQARRKVEKAKARVAVAEKMDELGQSVLPIAKDTTLQALKQTAFIMDDYAEVLSGVTVYKNKLGEYQEQVDLISKEIDDLYVQYNKQKALRDYRVYKTGQAISAAKKRLHKAAACLSVAKHLTTKNSLGSWTFR